MTIVYRGGYDYAESAKTRSNPLSACGAHQEETLISNRIIDVTTTDPAEFEVTLRPWELMCRPSDAGPFRHRLLLLQTPLFMMYTESYDMGVHVQGMTPPGVIGLGVPRRAGRQSKYWGISHDETSLPASLSGPVEGRLVKGHEQIIIFIDKEYLEQSLSPLLYETLITNAANHRLRTTADMEKNLDNWVAGTLRRFIMSPGLVQSRLAIEAALGELTDHVARIAGSLSAATDIQSPSKRKRALLRVIDYLRYDRTANLPLHKLCEIAGVGERSLQYAFHEELGLTPKEFMMRRRLHNARQELLFRGVEESSVTDVALKYGFLELGRFAGQYKKLFGELPSKTLMRSP